MIGRLVRQLVGRQLVSFRALSTTGYVLSAPHDISEKDFHPRKALLIRKVTRYEYEKLYLKPELSEEELKKHVIAKGSDYDALVQRHEEYYRSLEEFQEALVKKGIDYRLIHRYDYDPSFVNWADVIFTAGGDGTFLMAASKVGGRSKPVIGINTDPIRSEGFLCLPKQFSKNMTSVLEKLMHGDFKWYWRQRIRLTMYGLNAGDVPVDLYKQQMLFPEFRFWEHVRENEQVNSQNSNIPEELRPRVLPVLALNEVFIGECLSARVSFYELSVDGCPRLKQKSSGLTVCSGTGSTSWYFNMSNITNMTAGEILRIAQKYRGCSNAQFQDDEVLQKVVNEYNSALVFSPSDLKMAYSIRDPLSAGVFQVTEPRGFCNKIWVKSRMWDAYAVVDGSVSFKFNDGAALELDLHEEDALRCVRML